MLCPVCKGRGAVPRDGQLVPCPEAEAGRCHGGHWHCCEGERAEDGLCRPRRS